jgi:tetratricopeptide (TPR) repeat protein
VDLLPGAEAGRLSVGLGLAGVRQAFTLSSPLPGINASQLSAQAFSMDAGIIARPWRFLSLGFSGQDLNEPDLGVVSVARVPRTLRWGLGLILPGGLAATVAQTDLQGTLQAQGGLQWTLPWAGLALRAGVEQGNLDAGFGLAWKSLSVDYAYQWALPGTPGDALPGTNAFELAYVWARRPASAGLAEQGHEALEAGHYGEAMTLLRAALRDEPGNPVLAQEFAQARRGADVRQAASYADEGAKALAQGRPHEGLEFYQWAQRLDPDAPAYAEGVKSAQAALPQGVLSDARVQKLVDAALQSLAQGRGADAVKSLDAAVALVPADASLAALRAALAAATAKKQAPAPSADAGASMRLMEEALEYSGKGQADLARQAWQKVLKADPDNALAAQALKAAASKPAVSAQDRAKAQELFNRGLGAYQAGDLKGAAALWQQSVDLDPENLNARNNLARARIELLSPQ